MGCSQSKATDVSTPSAPASATNKKEQRAAHKPQQELESDEPQEKERHEPTVEDSVDEAPTTLEPVAPVIDTSVREQAPDSSAVDVPDSVRANFSSFNISFIDPTVSAPVSTTTEPSVASTRVAVVADVDLGPIDTDEVVKQEAVVKETELTLEEVAGPFETEEAGADHVEVAAVPMTVEELVVQKVETPAATMEEPLATIERVQEPVVVVEALAAVLNEEIVADEQIDTKVEDGEVPVVGIVATAKSEKESGVVEIDEKDEEGAVSEGNEQIATVAERVAASEEIDAVVGQPAATATAGETMENADDPVTENNAAWVVDAQKAGELVVENAVEVTENKTADELYNEDNIAEVAVEKAAEPVAENVTEEVTLKLAEPAMEETVAKCVVEKTAEQPCGVENVGDPTQDGKVNQLVKSENKVIESDKEKAAEPISEKIDKEIVIALDEKCANPVKETTDVESIKLAEVTRIAISSAEFGVVDNAVEFVQEPATVSEEPVAVATSD